MKVSFRNNPYQHRVSLELTLVKINIGIELGLYFGALGRRSPTEASGVSCEACLGGGVEWLHLRWESLSREMLVTEP